MKIRLGFVSNSSSSSFIAYRTNYPNTFAIAEAMLKIRQRRYDSWRKFHELEKIRMAQEKKLNCDIPVTFATYNYDTFITPKADRFIISTCSNTDWSELNITSAVTMEEILWMKSVKHKIEYWYIEEGLLATPIDEEEIDKLLKDKIIPYRYCMSHSTSYVRTSNGMYVCPGCWHDSNPGKDMFLDQRTKIIKPHYIPRKSARFR